MKVELKIKKLSSADISEAVNGRIVSFGGGAQSPCTGVCTGSGEVSEGALFCAIRGSRVDGHTYIADAINRGAVCALADHIPDNLPEGSFDLVLVDDTVAALGKLSAAYYQFASVKTVAVTGSVGKTTTKEFIYAVISEAYRTHKTEGNHNNEIGLPMTLLSMLPEDEMAVLEMGMSGFGEINYMSCIAKPDIAVITNIGTAHLASLGSRENICKAKMEIIDGMKNGGMLFVNGDEPLLAKAILAHPELRINTYGMAGDSCDYRAENIRSLENGMIYDLIWPGGKVSDVYIPTLGEHNVYNSVVAFGIGIELGIPEEKIRLGLASFVNADMRQKIYTHNGTTIIEDCYNASPESMRAALGVLSTYVKNNGGRSVALLGDMLELGDDSANLHRQVGEYVVALKTDLLFCYGSMAKNIAEAAVESGMSRDKVYVCENSGDPEKMAQILKSNVKCGDVILAKASRGISLEKVLELYKS